jgi:hypothetical protein
MLRRATALRGQSAAAAWRCSARRARLSSLVPRRKPDEPLHFALLFTPEQQRAVLVSRAAERRRFGAPVWQVLGAGLLGVGVVARWYASNWPEDGWSPLQLQRAGVRLPPFALVTEQAHVEALLSEVRVVLDRHGIGIGAVPLRVRLMDETDFRLHGRHAVEGTTSKVLRPPPVLRGVEAVSLQPRLTAIHSAQVLAHEYMHAWLWLHGFPPLAPRLEEGLCELVSYLYLLSCLHEPLGGAGALEHEPAALRQQIGAIEANAHPDYGGGFRDCVRALRGRALHDVLSHVRQHAQLPPPIDNGDAPPPLASTPARVQGANG